MIRFIEPQDRALKVRLLETATRLAAVFQGRNPGLMATKVHLVDVDTSAQVPYDALNQVLTEFMPHWRGLRIGGDHDPRLGYVTLLSEDQKWHLHIKLGFSDKEEGKFDLHFLKLVRNEAPSTFNDHNPAFFLQLNGARSTLKLNQGELKEIALGHRLRDTLKELRTGEHLAWLSWAQRPLATAEVAVDPYSGYR